MARTIEPVGRGDAVRARVPDVLRSYVETRASVLERGLVEPELKRRCFALLAGDEAAPGEAADERTQAALDWAQAIAWDAELADDALWERLHRHYTHPELVELGYYLAFTLGQLHWLRTLSLRPPDLHRTAF